MEFTASLKAIAEQIINLSSRLAKHVHTWNEEKSAPASGFTDRAGFIIYDDPELDIELYADVYANEDGTKSLLRARLAKSPNDDNDQNVFTIVTLDFAADLEKTRQLISNSGAITQQALVSLLNEQSTTPKYIQVSLESRQAPGSDPAGKRYEYDAEEINALNEADQAEFLDTLTNAFRLITERIR